MSLVAYSATPSMSLESRSIVVGVIGITAALLIILSLIKGFKVGIKPGFSREWELIELKKVASLNVK